MITMSYEPSTTNHACVLHSYLDGSDALIGSSVVPVAYATGEGDYSSPKDSTPFIPGQFKITALEKDRMHIKCTADSQIVYVIPQPYSKAKIYTVSGCITGKYNLTVNQIFVGIPDHRDLALTKAYAKVARNELDLATEFGELGETLEFIRHPYKKLGAALGQVVQVGKSLGRKDQSLSKLVSLSGGSYLETRFALMPLIRSFVEILEEYERKVKRFNAQKVHRAVGVIKDKGTNSLPLGAYAYGYFTGYALTESDWTQKTRACVYYRLTKPLPRLAEWGMSKSDLLPAAWELAKLSFVVDRFLNIGDFLRSHCIQPEVQLLGNTVAVKREARCTTSFLPKLPTGAQVSIWKPGQSVNEREHYVRIINVPVPNLPSVTNLSTLTNGMHIADHLALTQQLLSSKYKR